MKSKTTSLQILCLMLINLAVFSCKNSKIHNSKPITPDQADILTNEYKKHPDNVWQTYDPVDRQTPLWGFVFDPKQIDTIINHNASGALPLGTLDTNQVAFYFGLEKKPKRYYLIAYGMTKPYGVTGTGGFLLDMSTIAKQHPSIFESSAYSSSYVDPVTAASLRDNYNPAHLSTYVNNKKVPLYGFSFTAKHINDILCKNADGTPTVDAVVLDIGLEFTGLFNQNKVWHMIAYGIKNGVLYKTTVSKTAIYDKADPCPPCIPTPH